MVGGRKILTLYNDLLGSLQIEAAREVMSQVSLPFPVHQKG